MRFHPALFIIGRKHQSLPLPAHRLTQSGVKHAIPIIAQQPTANTSVARQPSPRSRLAAATTTAWFRSLAHKGGKGVVNNIDARSLGRIADEIEAMAAEIARLRAENAKLSEALEIIAGKCQPPDYLMGNSDIAIAALRSTINTKDGQP